MQRVHCAILLQVHCSNSGQTSLKIRWGASWKPLYKNYFSSAFNDSHYKLPREREKHLYPSYINTRKIIINTSILSHLKKRARDTEFKWKMCGKRNSRPFYTSSSPTDSPPLWICMHYPSATWLLYLDLVKYKYNHSYPLGNRLHKQ